jgi:hypothetical protein
LIYDTEHPENLEPVLTCRWCGTVHHIPLSIRNPEAARERRIARAKRKEDRAKRKEAADAADQAHRT